MNENAAARKPEPGASPPALAAPEAGATCATGIPTFDNIIWRETTPKIRGFWRAGPVSVLRHRCPDRTAAIAHGAEADILIFVEEIVEPEPVRSFVDGRSLGGGARPGAFCLVPAQAASDWVTRAGFACTHIHFAPSIRLLAGIEGDMPVLGWEGDPAVSRAVIEIAREAEAGEPGARLAVEGRALALAAHLLRRAAGRRAPAERAAAPLSPERLRRVADLVEADPSQPLGVADLAEAAGLSPAQFARAFRAATGETPHRWVMARRIARARAMLAEGRATTAEIALDCGFASQSHMTDVFRRFGAPSPARLRP